VSVWQKAPLVVGHRGGRGEGWPPENTMEAFDRAHAEGARAIELDTRLCASGEPVVFHDETLSRMTGGGDDRAIAAVGFRDLAQIDLGKGARVPLLADVLAWARANDTGVNVELKSEGSGRWALAQAASRVLRDARADVLVSSFDPLLLACMGLSAPRVLRACLTHAGERWLGPMVQQLVRPPLASALHLEASSIGDAPLARYLRRGLRIGVWTVNDPLQAIDLVRQGAASIITDAPGVLLAALPPVRT
jgi:glycerophosphoryl diester phosphodiesterase